MQKAVSGGGGRKGVPLDVWRTTDAAQCPKNSNAFQSPWQTHRAGISQESSAWSTSQSGAGRILQDQHSQRHHNHYTSSSSRGKSSNAPSDCDFPSLSAAKPLRTGAAGLMQESGSYSSPYIVAAQGTASAPPSRSCVLIRDCVKELRRLFPNADRDILEDVIAGIAMSSEADLCLGDLLEQAVSRLLDVFADDPGIQCAFPKFPASRDLGSAGQQPSTWKEKVGAPVVGRQKRTPHTAFSSEVATHSSDMEFYLAAINSLTERSARREMGPQHHADSESPCSVHTEGVSGAKLRMQSHRIAESRAQLFAEAARAFIAGDSKLAKELSARGHELTSEFRDLSAAAAEGIFRSKNPSLDEGVIDLHGLHRDEAFAAVTSFVEQLRLNPPNSSLGYPLVVCGKGIHSKGAPVLQGTAKDALIASGCTFHVLPGGTGTLVISDW